MMMIDEGEGGGEEEGGGGGGEGEEEREEEEEEEEREEEEEEEGEEEEEEEEEEGERKLRLQARRTVRRKTSAYRHCTRRSAIVLIDSISAVQIVGPGAAPAAGWMGSAAGGGGAAMANYLSESKMRWWVDHQQFQHFCHVVQSSCA